VNPHEKAPVLSAVSEPVEQPVIVTPSKNSNASGVDTENPVPEIVTVAHNGPCPGAIVTVSGVTMNDPVAD
jgi:hypothetical protein